MHMMLKLIAIIILIACSICPSFEKPRKPIPFCRIYTFAPKCRGASAKRDLQKLEPLLEEPRLSQEIYQDMKNSYQNKPWIESDNNGKLLLETLVTKFNPRNTGEYYDNTDDYTK